MIAVTAMSTYWSISPGTSIIGIQRELEAVLGVSIDLVPRSGLKERVRVKAERDLLPL